MRVKIYTTAGTFDTQMTSTQHLEESYPVFVAIQLSGKSHNINIRRSEIVAYEVLRG